MFVTGNIKNLRLKKCRGCKHFEQWGVIRFVFRLFPIFRTDKTAKCGLCNCFLGAKTSLSIAKCPDVPPKW